MRTRGRVVRRTGLTTWVKICHGEFCAGCGHHSATDQYVEVEAKNPEGAAVGQRVELESSTQRMLGVMLAVFWLPILAAGFSAWIGWAAASSWGWAPTPTAVVAGALGLVAAGALVYRLEKRAETALTIVAVLEDESDSCRTSGNPIESSCIPARDREECGPSSP